MWKKCTPDQSISEYPFKINFRKCCMIKSCNVALNICGIILQEAISGQLLSWWAEFIWIEIFATLFKCQIWSDLILSTVDSRCHNYTTWLLLSTEDMKCMKIIYCRKNNLSINWLFAIYVITVFFLQCKCNKHFTMVQQYIYMCMWPALA